MSRSERWTFGEAPLTDTVDLAAALRSLADVAVALEHPSDELRELTRQIVATTEHLGAHLPTDPSPRIGTAARVDQRVYLDHSRDIGDYSPCVPRYQLRCANDRAEGEVSFPVIYEGPPGIVHGGFLALLFDCVLQQLNCDLGLAGKTATLSVRYRRPTPLLTELRIAASREVVDDRIRSDAGLYLGEELLCAAQMSAVASNRGSLPAVDPRRPEPGRTPS